MTRAASSASTSSPIDPIDLDRPENDSGPRVVLQTMVICTGSVRSQEPSRTGLPVEPPALPSLIDRYLYR